jgi:hypothetical protein
VPQCVVGKRAARRTITHGTIAGTADAKSRQEGLRRVVAPLKLEHSGGAMSSLGHFLACDVKQDVKAGLGPPLARR